MDLLNVLTERLRQANDRNDVTGMLRIAEMIFEIVNTYHGFPPSYFMINPVIGISPFLQGVSQRDHLLSLQ